jgi:hypothetical protein
MSNPNSVVSVFKDHLAAENAIKKLAQAGFEFKTLSIVGKGYHSEEKAIGFYNTGDRMKFWGARGAFWGGLWGLFFGGLSVTVPVIGPVFVLGYLAAMVISAVEGALLVGGTSAIVAALLGIGVPKDSAIAYETAVKADGYLVMAHGSAAEVARARAVLEAAAPSRLDVHSGAEAAAPAPDLTPAIA